MLLSIKCLILFICIRFSRQVETVLVMMVIISKGLVNIDAKIFSNTERWFYQKYEALFSFMIDRFPFFLNFMKKTNAVIFHVNLYFFCGCANFFKKWKVRLLNLRVSGFLFPAIFLSLFKKNACVRKVNCKPFSVDICFLKGEAEYKSK